jgi:hypothetical protein
MLVVSFRIGGASRNVGPALWIEFRGPELRTSLDEGATVARYDSGHWIHTQTRALYIECSAVLSIQFTGPGLEAGPTLGPFSSLRVRDRYAFGGRGRVAKLSPSEGLWTPLDSPRSWPVMRVFSGFPSARGPGDEWTQQL